METRAIVMQSFQKTFYAYPYIFLAVETIQGGEENQCSTTYYHDNKKLKKQYQVPGTWYTHIHYNTTLFKLFVTISDIAHNRNTKEHNSTSTKLNSW